MEENEKKEIYFILCQNFKKSTVASIDTNSVVKKVEKLEEKNIEEDKIYILYHLIISNNYKGKPFNITLVNNMLECYTCYTILKNNEKIKYNLVFEPIYSDNSNNLNQILLSFKTQFNIFLNFFLSQKENQENNIKNSFFLNTIEYVSRCKSTDLNQKSLLLLFSKIYELNDKKEEINKDNILIYFFEKINFDKLFENWLANKENQREEITNEESKILKNIRNKLIINTGNKEEITEKIDLFIMFYIIYLKPVYFFEVLFENDGNNFEKIKEHLLKHKKVFKNFNSEILSSELFLDAESLESIILVIKGFISSMLELLKLFANSMFFMKFSVMLQMQKKYSIINLLDLCQPKKTDETEEFYDYFEKIYQNFRNEGFLPISFNEDFYLEYCNLFKNENYKKIKAMYTLLRFHNKMVKREYRIQIGEQIIDYYHETGIFLIEQKKLFNKEMFEFLEDDEFFNCDEKEKERKLEPLLNTICIGICFNKKESKFISDILNNRHFDEFNVKKFFGNLYQNFIKKIFNKITTPEDLLNLGNCDIRFDAPEEVLENFILMIKTVWSSHPINFPDYIQNIIAQSLSYSSVKIPEINTKVYYSLEEKIPKDILISTYTLILIKQYDISDLFRQHIIDYIQNNCGKDALSVWYLLNILDNDEYIRVDYLKNNLKDELSVKVEDFIGQSKQNKEKIDLFKKLRTSKYFNLLDGELTETSYYKNSIESKNNIINLKFKEAMYIYSKIFDFFNLFYYFTPIEITRDESEIEIGLLLINFREKFEPMKVFFESLKKISNYWNRFFPTDKKEENNKLKNIINIFENGTLTDFENFKKEYNFYIKKFLEEAQDGELLKDSLFFMTIFNKIKNTNKNEKDTYEEAKNSFSKFKNLDKDIYLLDNELKEIITESVHKNMGRLNNEINFIKNYFFKIPKTQINLDGEKEKDIYIRYKNFDVKKIKREILKLVNKLEIDDENEEEKQIEKIEEDEDNINNYDNIFDNVDLMRKESSEEIDREKILLIENIHKIGQNYINLSKIICETDNDKKNLRESFQKYFNKIFETNLGFAKLKDEFETEIMNYSKIIYMNNVDFDLLSNENTLILVSEFFDILDVLKENGKNGRKILLLLLKKINDIKANYDYEQISNYINNLFSFIKENIGEENSINLLIRILIKEVKRNNDLKAYVDLLKLIFSTNIINYEFLFSDLSPFIDSILGNEFVDCLKFNVKIDSSELILSFDSSCFQILEEKNYNNIHIEEMLLFYFESKLIKKFNDIDGENEFFDKNDNKFKYLEFFLNFLEEMVINKEQNNKSKYLMKLYSIAYIKCYYWKQVNYLYKSKEDCYLFKNAFQELYDGRGNSFRTSMMIYVLKLIFEIFGNLNDFEDENKNNTIGFKKIKEKLQKDGYYDLGSIIVNNNYGFDFMILPTNEIDYFFEVFNKISKIKKNSLEKNDYSNLDFAKNINELNNFDLFYCLLVNLFFSFSYVNYSEVVVENLVKYFERIIINKEILLLKDIDLLTKSLLLLINKESYKEKIMRSINVGRFLSYNQLLCILISFRYVLNVINFNNKEGLFYNLIIDPKNTFDKNKQILNIYLNEINKEERDINYLTYKIIKYIILSHLCISNLLDNITLEDAYEIINHNPIEAEGNYLLIRLFEEFDFIQNELLNTLGIKNIIVFMNSIFNDSLKVMNAIRTNLESNEFKIIEQNMGEIIKMKLSNYSQSVKDYYQNITKNEEYKIDGNNSKHHKLYNILLENNSLFKDKKINEEFPFISYFTYTNFCGIDDFKKQYLFENDNKSYPLLDAILKENKILKIIDCIPKFNEIVNIIYNELSMKISEDDKNKNIRSVFPNAKILKDFNPDLKRILDLFGEDKFDFEIKDESKIIEVINLDIEDNKIFKIYNWIINEYNNFFKSINTNKENKKYVKEVIIQNSSENDYITFKSNNSKSIQERLEEIIYLYSKRKRIYEGQKINVYDGGKIIYNFELIEEMLEKEFILCKRKFSLEQKLFIFSNKIFSGKRNKLFVDLNIKYPQIEIKEDEMINNINKHLNNNKDKMKEIYYNCLYVIIYLMEYLKNEKSIDQNTNIKYIIKLMKKENNKLVEPFEELFENLKLKINQIFYLYELIEEKVFDSLTQIIKEEFKSDERMKISEEREKEIQKELNDNSLLKQDVIIKAIKKYFVRYCLGDNSDNKSILNNIKINDVFNKIDIWDKTIFEKNLFKEESKKLCDFNQKENCMLIYFYRILFDIENELNNDRKSSDSDSGNNLDADDKDDEL